MPSSTSTSVVSPNAAVQRRRNDVWNATGRTVRCNCLLGCTSPTPTLFQFCTNLAILLAADIA